MNKNCKGTVLITGASSGIGRELALIFAQEGYNLVIIARDKKKILEVEKEIKKLSSKKVLCILQDLSDINAPEKIFKKVKSQAGHIDILINNAGFGWIGDFASMDVKTALEMIQVNISALTALTRLFLTDMLAKNSGKIMNVASTAAFQAGPYMAVYYATKAYVLSFSQALNEELKDTNITVTAFCPGPVETNFGARAGFSSKKLFGGLASMDVKKVAMIGYKGMMRGKPVVVAGFLNWLGTQVIRFLPRSLPPKFIKRIQRHRRANG